MYKYEWIVQDLQSKLIKGTWKEGQNLPSIRQLSDTYQCSKSTIIRAYAELERQHLIYAIPQSGYYVVKQEKQNTKLNVPTINFSSTTPDPALFPYRDFQHCLNQAIDRYKNDLFTYGTPQGLPSLIKVLQKQLANHQIFASTKQIVVTSGVQQALSVLTNMAFPNKKHMVLVEQPSYHLFLQMLQLRNISTLGIERTAEGLDLNQLEYLFQTKPIKFFYTMPRFHNPLGTSLTQKEKKTLADLAKRYKVYIVEDDYLMDLEGNPKADPIFSNQNEYLIYLKSFSKILFPGLRVGVVILPNKLIPDFIHYKRTHDIDSSMLSQASLEIYIQNGMYQYHRQKIRTAYQSRIQKLHELLTSLPIDDYISYPSIKTGVHTHLMIDQPISLEKLQKKLAAQHIIIGNIRENYFEKHPYKNIVRLNVSNIHESNLEKGVTTVLKEVKHISNLYRRQFF
jgi:DNA-binding transcriptional MocR family regulator